MCIGGIIILSGIFILVSICCFEIVVFLTNKRQNKNLENEKHIEQNTDEIVEQNTDKTDESLISKKVKTDKSLIGEKVKIDGIKCTVIDVDKFGKPCAWLSNELPLNIEPPYNWCTREYALSLRFNNGWHIPSYDELLRYKQNIKTSCGSVICWTTTFYDSMCYYGNPNDKDFKPKRAVRIIRTI